MTTTAADPRTAPVPLVDLTWQHRVIADELLPAWHRTLEATAYVGGPSVARFEESFARFCGVERCVGVANGTDAIELALRAVGIGHGDRVAIPANTFFATAEAVVRAGAEPVFVDCDVDTALMCTDDLERVLVRHRPEAIVPVHLYGQLAEMESVNELAAHHRAVVVEDAAQAQGAHRHGRAIGRWGALAATSFYPGKNLGAFGDAGGVLTDDPELADRVRLLANHGSSVRYRHQAVGTNSRLDTLQADVLLAKLAHLAAWNDLRRAAAAYYDQALAGLPQVTRPAVLPGNHHVWHLYVVQLDERDRVLDGLHAAGIGAGIHYPVPVHLQPAFGAMGHRLGNFPRAETMAGRILSLPLFPGITSAQQDRVVDTLEGLVG